MTPLRMRTATADDLEEIVDLFLRCWTTAYAVVLPERTLSTMDHRTATEHWRQFLTGGPGTEVVTVATEDDDSRILGLTRRRPEGDRVGLVDSLYVLPAAQGRGIGARLLAAAADAFAADGASRVVLWVFEANAPARAFYARQGWRPTGQQRVDPRFGIQELQLARSLVPEPAT